MIKTNMLVKWYERKKGIKDIKINLVLLFQPRKDSHWLKQICYTNDMIGKNRKIKWNVTMSYVILPRKDSQWSKQTCYRIDMKDKKMI